MPHSCLITANGDWIAIHRVLVFTEVDELSDVREDVKSDLHMARIP
jgi:hypothetical protein